MSTSLWPGRSSLRSYTAIMLLGAFVVLLIALLSVTQTQLQGSTGGRLRRSAALRTATRATVLPGGATVAGVGIPRHLVAMRVPEVWSMGIRGDGITGIVSTGIQCEPSGCASPFGTTHPLLVPLHIGASVVLSGTNLSDAAAPIGTAAAGAATANDGPAPGVVPEGDVAAIKASIGEDIDPSALSYAAILTRLGWGIQRGLRIEGVALNFVGTYGPSHPTVMRAARDINRFYGNGLIVAATGEGGETRPPEPVPDNMLFVAAVDGNERLLPGSRFGDIIEVVAPGENILTTTRMSSVGEVTSHTIVAAEVAGVANLILQANPTLTAEQMKAIIIATARDIGAPGRDDQTGYGMVDAYAAVQEACSRPGASTLCPGASIFRLFEVLYVGVVDTMGAFSTVGEWIPVDGVGLKGTALYATDPDAYAEFTFRGLQRGQDYMVGLTWPTDDGLPQGSSDVRVRIQNGSYDRTFSIDQSRAPGMAFIDGLFEQLPEPFTATSTTAVVTIWNADPSSGVLWADTVRAVPFPQCGFRGAPYC